MCGCFVNSEKDILLELKETFLNLDEDDYFKYLELARKVLSGTIGNNILELNFSNGGEEISNKQLSLIKLNDADCEPIKLTKDELQNVLLESCITKENAIKIEIFYDENFNDDFPLAEKPLLPPGKYDNRLMKDYKLASEYSISSVPTFIVNEKYQLSGIKQYNEFKKMFLNIK